MVEACYLQTGAARDSLTMALSLQLNLDHFTITIEAGILQTR
jgi:hypothetical protein